MSGRLEEEIKSSAPLPLEVQFMLNVQRTSDRLVQWTDSVLGEAGLGADEYNVLRILRGAGEDGHPRGEVQERMIQTPRQFPALVHNLKKRGLIDGTLTLMITEAGLDLLASVDGTIEDAARERLKGIGASRLRSAIEVLEEARGAE